MRNPVLVRVMPDGEVSSNIGDISNTQGGLALNATEQANNDARRIDLPNLQFAPDGGVSQATVRQFVQAMPTSEQGGLIDTNGIPTRQAVDRVNAAIFAKAYGNDGLVRLFAQAQDPEARLILSALAQVAPDMARLDGVGDLDIRDIVAQAAEIAVNARRDGRTIADAAAQLDLTTDAGVMAVLDLFARYPRQSKPVAQALQRAAQFAYQEANKPANDMFGSVPRASRQDVINQLQEQGYGNQQTGQADLGQQGGRQLDGQDAIGRSTDRARPADAGAVETNRAAGTEPAARAEPDARAAYSGYAGQLDDSGRPLKWRTSKGAATLVANALGIDVAGLTGKEIVAAIEAHDAQQQTLTSYDAADLQERDAQQQAADKAEQAEQKRLEDKAKADSQRGEFTLTGSDRAADVGTAAGQQGLRFSVAPKSQTQQDTGTQEQAALEAVRTQYEGTAQWMKAPNGKPTKLNDRQWLQVRTPQFKEWFGDWETDPANASKVVDENGEPLVVYHGTDADFSVFKEGVAYFTPDTRYSYITNSSSVYPTYLNIKNPYRTEYQRDAEGARSWPDWIDELRGGGYDGIIYARHDDITRGPSGWGNDYPQIVSFAPTQIKSAIGNTGAFSKSNPDIRFSRRQNTKAEQEKNLIAQHNLTARALLHAVKMGGLPVPSVAITKVDSPLDNFGELTLIGDVSMIDPKAGGGAKVFGADIYSPRYPATELNLSKDTIKRAQELLADGMQATRKRHIEFAEIERDKGRALAQEPAFMWQFLQKRGVVPNVPANASSHDVYLELKQQIRDAELEDALLADAERFLEDLDADERIFNGYSAQGNRRYIPHTLDNLVKLMKKNLRGGEGVNYGTGSLRAQFAPQFKSVEQIRKAKDKLVTEADFASIKQDIDAEFWKSAETISKDISGSTAVAIMEDAAKIGVQQAASNYGITVDDAAAAKVEDFLAKLRNLPTEYFEAKITRAVSLSEFAAAVVPEDASAEVMQALRDAGIDNIRTYVRNDAASRKQAIQAATAERDGLRFSQSPQKSVEANIRRGRAAMQRALLEKADQHRAMFRNGLGWVDFVWDDAKKGIQHLLERRQDADGMTLAQAKRFVLEDVVAAIAQGQEVRRTEVGKALRVTVAHNNVEAILVRRTGTNAWVLTAFEVLPDPNVRSATQALGTQSTPIRSRHELAGSANSLALGGQHGNTATPADVQAIKSAATAAVGQKRAAKVDVLTRDEVGKRSGLERLMGVTKAQQEAEGYFDPATGRVVLVADNIKEVKTKAGKVVMTRDQRAAYVAWHELTHRALAAKGQAVDGVAYGVHYNAVIDGAGSNATVRALANAIHTERKGEISHALAVEEAMATLRPMIKSGDYAALQELYGVAVPKGMQAGLRGAFERFVQGMRRLIARITGADTAQWDDAQVFEVLAGLDRYDTARYEGEGAGGRFSTAPQPQVASGKQGNAWQAPEPTRFDDVVYQLQNKHIDLKRVIESIEKAHGAPLDDAFNPLQKEELYHGMAAKRTQMFEIDELQPLLKTMTRLGVEMDAVEEYLHARHAQEANAVIAARNPDNPNLADGGSGMSNAAAKAYFAKLAPANKARLKTRCCKPWQRSISKKAFTPIAAYAHALPSDLGSRSACPKASDKAGATQF